ncbi:hypothetical protein [Nocardioides pyridinolyticus]
MSDDVSAFGGTRRRLVTLTAFGAIPTFVLSLAIVLATALRDTELVATQAGQRSVDLGWPWAWIRQDQHSLDPPLPDRMGFTSPWESPTSLSGVAFVENVLVVFTVLTVGGLLAGALIVVLTRAVRASRLFADN